ncbi:MFS transporter [Sphingomonas sp.]|uniref:MFS transporter n=1 Tax=Sphingomonas sp. TaxID=28214 RepID=UPI002DD6AE76|nr:MFS transporter [Sphingomonas sp.]
MSSNREWREGGVPLFGSVIGLGTSLHLHFYVSTLFVTGLVAEFGWSRGQIATAQAIAMWGVVAAPLVGRLIDRVGVRNSIIFGQVAIALSYLALSGLPGQLWMYVLFLALLQALGQASGTAAHTRAIAERFSVNRGMAMGIAITGIPVFGALMAPILTSVIEGYSWRAGYVVLAGLSLFVGMPIAAALVKDRRSDRSAGQADTAGPISNHAGYLVRDLPRLPAFWLLMAALILINVPGGGLLGQLAPLLQDRGLSAVQAAWFVSAFAGAVIVGRLLSGYLLDRTNPVVVAAIFTCAPAVGMFMLAMLGQLTPATAFVAVAMIGVQQGAEIDLLAYFTARYFGLKSYSAIYGIGYATVTIATSVGITLFGLTYDWTGAYQLVLYVSCATFLLAAVCFLALGKSPVVSSES